MLGSKEKCDVPTHYWFDDHTSSLEGVGWKRLLSPLGGYWIGQERVLDSRLAYYYEDRWAHLRRGTSQDETSRVGWMDV